MVWPTHGLRTTKEQNRTPLSCTVITAADAADYNDDDEIVVMTVTERTYRWNSAAHHQLSLLLVMMMMMMIMMVKLVMMVWLAWSWLMDL